MTGSIATRADGVPISFRDDPLLFFDHQISKASDTFWLPDSVLCVAEPRAAKAILANPDGLFEEHSDLFHTRKGPLGPRAAQITIGRAVRRLLGRHVTARAEAWPVTIEGVLGSSSVWPHAGQYLIYRHLRPALVDPSRDAAVGSTVDRVMERGVLVGARESHSGLSRFFFRRRVFKCLRQEVELRLADSPLVDEPRDLFDVLALAAEHGVSTQELGELYVPLFFAIASSVPFGPGMVDLLARHPSVHRSEGQLGGPGSPAIVAHRLAAGPSTG